MSRNNGDLIEFMLQTLFELIGWIFKQLLNLVVWIIQSIFQLITKTSSKEPIENESSSIQQPEEIYSYPEIIRDIQKAG